jgi:HlyD family secretion protein
MKNCLPAKAALLALAALALAGCRPRSPTAWQGYLEGEFVQLSSPLPGRLDRLTVQKGARVTAGTPLFTLEQGAELATLRESAERVRAAQARLADLRKGQRPSELATLAARQAQARAAAELAAREFERISRLHQNKVASDDDYDRLRLNHEGAEKLVTELSALLETAQLGARADVISAAEAEAAAAQAALDRAGWAVADTLYREGEFVAAAAPVVTLLPPENIKVRFFVPEAEFGRLKTGDTVQVTLSGRDAPLEARISYLSPKPEYTPPVLYNRENRSKLVFLVEAALPDNLARDLHPGQPVEVTLTR